MNEAQTKRIWEELKTVGVGPIGLRTPEAKDLAGILHSEEHVGGVIYGRYEDGLGWLVATDERILFLDHKPFFKSTDEITYDAVSGIKSTKAGLFVSIVLHTRLGDYTVRYVNATCARIFIQFVEKKRIQNSANDQGTDDIIPSGLQIVNDEALNFLREHDLGVLSTIDRTGNVHGAVVYYYVDQYNYVYILTKSATGKGRNVYAHSQVALTIHEAGTMQTVQLQGIAIVETDQNAKDEIFNQMVRPRVYRDGNSMPPITKLHEGAFMVIKISPTLIDFHDYAKVE